MVELKPGQQLASSVSDARVVVVRAPAGAVIVTCGGHEMVPADQEAEQKQQPAGGSEGALLVGKRYADVEDTVELLCTRSGNGQLAVDGVALEVKAAKPLPSSD